MKQRFYRRELTLVSCALAFLLGPADGAVAVEAPKSDIVVVGSGISGLCAALEAARAGASVTVVDMASIFGGHAVMATGMVCLVDTPEQRANQVFDSAKLAQHDFLEFGEDADPEWVRIYAQNSRREIYDWLQGVGMTEWELFPRIIPGNSVRRQHVAKGRGIGLVSPIYRECLRYPNINFVWNTRVDGLIVESQRVVGARGAHLRGGQTEEFRAPAVILATGGFESNLELIRANWPKYFPPLADGARILLGSGINSMGSGLALAGQAGGALSQLDHQLYYSTGLADPRDPTGRRGLHAFNVAAIWVNAQGRRFVRDGAPDPKLQMPAVLRQTPPTYWAIFDAATRAQFFVSGSDWNDPGYVQEQIFANSKLAPWVTRADSLENLAQVAGLPAATLADTVKGWNEMVERGEDSEFHRFNQASDEHPIKIQIPPFYAVQFVPLARKSLGGVAVDYSCRVVDGNRRPIPGLYAVGELTGVGGINGRAALEGTMLGPSILMGRMAAKEIVRGLTRAAAVASSPIEPATRKRATDPTTLRGWQEVLGQLCAQPRPGYLHFEKAHRVVLSRGYDCARCHGDAEPLVLTEDLLDRHKLVQSCVECHGGVRE